MIDVYPISLANPAYRPAPPVARTAPRRRMYWAWVAVLLVGCAVAPVVTDHGPALRAPVAQLKRDLPIETAPKQIQTDVAAIDTAIDTFVAEDDATQAKLAVAVKALADERAHFWSYRQRCAWYWMIGIVGTILLAVAVTSFFSGGATGAAALGFFGHLASTLLTGGLHGFQLIFQKIGAWRFHEPTIAANLQAAQAKVADAAAPKGIIA